MIGAVAATRPAAAAAAPPLSLSVVDIGAAAVGDLGTSATTIATGVADGTDLLLVMAHQGNRTAVADVGTLQAAGNDTHGSSGSAESHLRLWRWTSTGGGDIDFTAESTCAYALAVLEIANGAALGDDDMDPGFNLVRGAFTVPALTGLTSKGKALLVAATTSTSTSTTPDDVGGWDDGTEIVNEVKTAGTRRPRLVIRTVDYDGTGTAADTPEQTLTQSGAHHAKGLAVALPEATP